jgi:hypothetical protein
LLDELIKVNTEQLEDETEMLSVDEGILESKEMMVIVLVVFRV